METFVCYSCLMSTPHPSLRLLSAAALSASFAGCTLVGYPAGTPTGGVVPSVSSSGARVAGRIPEERPRSDAGRTYEVWGVRYQVLSTAEGYEEVGQASWYGPQFNGRPTASGETFDMYDFSAAHRTLPLHTWVEVTNLENGRALIIRVNDRGPFAHTDQRIIDLSFGAAEELDVVGAGIARVRVRALSEGEVDRLR